LRDRALATELGANARATVLADFDWRQICLRIEHIYDRLLGASAAATHPLSETATPAAIEH